MNEGTLLNGSYEANISLIPQPDKDITEKKWATNLSSEDTKILNKILTKPNPTTHKKDHTHNQMGFISGMQGWFNIWKSINSIHHSNRIKKKKCMILIDSGGKNPDKIFF